MKCFYDAQQAHGSTASAPGTPCDAADHRLVLWRILADRRVVQHKPPDIDCELAIRAFQQAHGSTASAPGTSGAASGTETVVSIRTSPFWLRATGSVWAATSPLLPLHTTATATASTPSGERHPEQGFLPPETRKLVEGGRCSDRRSVFRHIGLGGGHQRDTLHHGADVKEQVRAAVVGPDEPVAAVRRVELDTARLLHLYPQCTGAIRSPRSCSSITHAAIEPDQMRRNSAPFLQLRRRATSAAGGLGSSRWPLPFKLTIVVQAAEQEPDRRRNRVVAVAQPGSTDSRMAQWREHR